MKITVFSSHTFEKKYIENANQGNYELNYVASALSIETLSEINECAVIIIFSTDIVDKKIINRLKELNVELIVTRSAGTDHIDLDAARNSGLKIANVPTYSPNAIAEHSIALTLALYRKLKTSFSRIGAYNFSLNGQVGKEIKGKTVGIFGTGDIGAILANLFHCFGAEVKLYDKTENTELKTKYWAKYVSKRHILKECDIISLNLPLNDETNNFITNKEFNTMKKNAILINTGRGELLNTKDAYCALIEERIAGLAMDVYENEKGVFYNDLSRSETKDELLTSLIALDNVVVTSHQGFLTDTALDNMMETVFLAVKEYEQNNEISNLIKN